MDDSTTNNICHILRAIEKITGKWPKKNHLQKLVYLLENKGVPLRYDYALHFYGPYSADLDWDTHDLEFDGIVKFQHDGHTHLVTLRGADMEIETSFTSATEIQIDELINRYESWTPSELELLATALYAYEVLTNKTRQNVVEGVRKIKGKKYPVGKIESALDEFGYFGKVFSGA
jgi:uncharacterized protein YwgA